MNLLKISDHVGYFKNQSDEYKPISEVKKEDIFYLLNYIYNNDDFSFDESGQGEEKNILAPADKIIYERLYKKFCEVTEKKQSVIAQVDAEFKDAIEKYVK